VYYLVPKLQFENAYCQAPLGVTASKFIFTFIYPERLAELEGRRSHTAIKLRKAVIKNNVFSFVFESSIKP
jgi:hypothetical protein